MQLNQHGMYEIGIEGDVLWVRVVGDWNEVAVHNLARDAAGLWPQFAGRPWGLLVDARQWGAATPEGMEAWEHVFMPAIVKGGAIGRAVVPPSNFHLKMTQERSDRVGQQGPHHAGLDIDAARAWLRGLGLATGDGQERA